MCLGLLDNTYFNNNISTKELAHDHAPVYNQSSYTIILMKNNKRLDGVFLDEVKDAL